MTLEIKKQNNKHEDGGVCSVSCELTVKSAPFSHRTALNSSNVGCLSARLMMNSAVKKINEIK